MNDVTPRNGGADYRTNASWADRLQAAAEAVKAAEEAKDKAHDMRDDLIVAACEAHVRQEDVARWAGVSQSRVCRILGEH